MNHQPTSRLQVPRLIWVIAMLLVGCSVHSVGSGAEAADAELVAWAQRIFSETGVRGGLVVHLGCGDGRLTAELGAGERFLVHGFAADPADVVQARTNAHTRGLSSKVTFRQLDTNRLPYAENMVNLLVVDASCELRDAGSEILRVLAPRGAAVVREAGNEAWLARIPYRVSRIGDGFAMFAKPVPKEIDEWTHWLHGADGNAVADDTIADSPRRLQWIAKPYWSRHHHTVPSVTGFVSSGGRVFYVVDEAPGGMNGSAPDKWSLVARDAFNGLPLWRRPMPEWGWVTWSADWTCRFTIPTHISRRLVAIGDRVYTTLGFNAPLVELDAATGEILRTFEDTALTDEILYENGLLILAVNQAAQRPGPKSKDQRGEVDEPPVTKWVVAIEASSGKILWKTGDFVGLRSKTGSMERISHLSMCAGDGRLFFVNGDRIVALSLADGRELWRASRPEIPEHRMRYNIRLSDMCSLVYARGVLYFAQLNPDKRVGWRGVRGRLHAFSADEGEPLWDRQCASWGWGHPADVFVVDGLVWAHDFETSFILGMDPSTGEVQRKVSNFQAFDNGHHHRCYRNKATTRFMMTSYRGLEFIDWGGKQTDLNHWVRGTCRLGAFPCNGLIYATPHPCSCYVSSKLNGFLALAPEERTKDGVRTKDEGQRTKTENRLEKGPAYADVHTSPPPLRPSSLPLRPSEDWPMYRHDRSRSGSTATSLSSDLEKAWEVEFGSKPTSCVAVGETVLVAVPDSHQVVALRANDGSQIWSFATGGRIDTPPTIDGGRAYFGCADGWLYCLHMTDGRLVWRLRGAPRDRLVGALDGIESAWPIHGSPLVEDGIVYFTAGRSSFLDGGILALAVDARSGKIVSHRTISSEHSMQVDAGTDRLVDSGLLSDLLVGRGESIYMRQRQVFPASEDTGGGEPPQATPNDVLRTTTGMLDDEWFSRARWYLGDRPIAEYLVFDNDAVYGVRAREAMTGYGGFFSPGTEGYELFTASMDAIRGVDAKQVATAGKREYGIKIPKRWSVRVPLRITAMVLAGDTLFAGGTPDVLDRTNPWAAYEGRRGGKLLAISATEGKVVAEHELDAPAILDGMIVASGRLLVSTSDGKIVCYAKGE